MGARVGRKGGLGKCGRSEGKGRGGNRDRHGGFALKKTE